MDKIAFVIGNCIFSWYAVLITLAVLTAVAAFQLFYQSSRERVTAGLLAVPLALVLGLLLARIVHWYCRSNSYSGFLQAMTDWSTGGYALIGAFAGCFLAAALLRLLRISRDLPAMLDAMCIAGSLGIALGRPAFLFSALDRGQTLVKAPFLPELFRVVNTVSGAEECRFPTFALQAAAAGVIFLILTILYLCGTRKRSGDITLVFLLLYCTSQILLDSTRLDSLFFRSNGFVSVVQIFCALGSALVVILFSIRLVRAMGMHKGLLAVWILTAAFLGGAGYMEYYTQRHSLLSDFSHTIMALCLLFLAAAGLLIRRSAILCESAKRS